MPETLGELAGLGHQEGSCFVQGSDTLVAITCNVFLLACLYPVPVCCCSVEQGLLMRQWCPVSVPSCSTLACSRWSLQCVMLFLLRRKALVAYKTHVWWQLECGRTVLVPCDALGLGGPWHVPCHAARAQDGRSGQGQQELSYATPLFWAQVGEHDPGHVWACTHLPWHGPLLHACRCDMAAAYVHPCVCLCPPGQAPCSAGHQLLLPLCFYPSFSNTSLLIACWDAGCGCGPVVNWNMLQPV